MEKRSYRDLFGIFGKWLGVFLEIFRKPGVFIEIWGTAAWLQRNLGASLQNSRDN
jgi:hypothetical protein